jgi:hypothetical protein
MIGIVVGHHTNDLPRRPRLAREVANLALKILVRKSVRRNSVKVSASFVE